MFLKAPLFPVLLIFCANFAFGATTMVVGDAVSRAAAQQVQEFLKKNQHELSNTRYFGIVDFSQNSGNRRFCVVETASGNAECVKVAHGRGSDGGNGWARRFSNKFDSGASSLGFYKTKEVYSGKHGRSLRLMGLSETNSNALSRSIVVHSADYVKDSGSSRAGRSLGCFALDSQKIGSVISKLKGGAVILAWYSK